MMKAIILLFLISFILSGKTHAQITWTKTYQDTAEITCLVQYNQSYVGFGYKNSKLNYIRTDKNGDTLIKKVIADTAYTGFFWASSATKTMDNKLVVAGIQNMNVNNEALRIYKLDSLGHIIWNHVYPNTSPNGPMFKMVSTADSGFAVFGHDALQGYLIKIDKDGNQVFRKNYGYSYMYPRDAVVNNDGSFVICGYQGLFGFTNFLFKTDALGNIIWTQSITSTPLFESITNINSNYYVLGSRSNGPVTLFKFNSQGNLIGQTSTGQNGAMYSMKSDYNKNIICSGSISNADTVGLLKIDTLGNVLCKKTKLCLNTAESLTCLVDNDSNYVYAGTIDNRSFISKVTCKLSTTGVNTIYDNNISLIYPNPFTNQLFIKTTSATKIKFEINDCNGRILISDTLQNIDTCINVSQLSSGIYFVKLYNEKSITIKKLIKL